MGAAHGKKVSAAQGVQQALLIKTRWFEWSAV